MGLLSLSLLIMSIYIIPTILLFHLVVANSLQSDFPTCHDDEISALLQFKQTFVIDRNASSFFEGAYPKIFSWKLNNNCCSWDGIECDDETGQVIGVDLSSSCLHGSINSSSSLFRLIHLERLNLADNDFNSSHIPSTISNFPKLRYLNLSLSGFSGHVPFEISLLSKLSHLDLSSNEDMFANGETLRTLSQNLTGLETLSLSDIDISSMALDAFTNLSHLTSLHLRNCSLFGTLPSFLGNLRHLIYLDLSNNEFHGQIHASLESFDQLTTLSLNENNLSGPIPASLGNLTRLKNLWLSGNKLNGSIPPSLFSLMNLQSLNLFGNNLSGTVEFHKFLNLQKLTHLSLSYNKLEVFTESPSMNNATTAVPKFKYLALSGCNIREFPDFLRSQDSLWLLNLSGNNLRGRVPKWMWSIQTLQYLNVSHNFLSGFAQPPTVLPLVKQYVDLSFNRFGGSLWIPSTSMAYYTISNNKLTGQVPPSICDLTSLQYLDLSNNMLSGMLPQCLGIFGQYLQFLNLGNNLFHGNLPEAYTNGSNLRMVDISRNNFHGQLPRSLADCTSLEVLVLSHNKFTETFPDWLGTLPELKILTMDHNGFYGVISKPKKMNLHFPALRILDLSSNNFSGRFPFEYIFSGNVRASITHGLGYYSMVYVWWVNSTVSLLSEYYSKITINIKGVERYYPKILEDLILIDISNNNFEGKIPEFIGKLNGIWSLNFSNNILTGSIPSSLGNLSSLESLDLSHNKLSGEIPQQLTKLDFLATFNVSYNNLTGPVPHGNHFTTFDSASYLGNPGLCGESLTNKCWETPGVPHSRVEENDSESGGIEFSWKFVLAGVVSGLVVGVVLVDVAITRWPEWFNMIVAILIRQMGRRRKTTAGQKLKLMKRRFRN